MGYFFSNPEFQPNTGPIPLGSAGQVLTMTGGLPRFGLAGSGGAVGAGAAETFASPAGANNNVTPPAPYPAIGRLFVTLAGGNANWTGLSSAGVSDGQIIYVKNIDAVNTLTLNNENAGSLAANRFDGVGDLVLPPGATTQLIYTAGTRNRWDMH